MTNVRKLHRKWMKDPAYRKSHRDLAPEFKLACTKISARATDIRPIIKLMATKRA